MSEIHSAPEKYRVATRCKRLSAILGSRRARSRRGSSFHRRIEDEAYPLEPTSLESHQTRSWCVGGGGCSADSEIRKWRRPLDVGELPVGQYDIGLLLMAMRRQVG